MRGGAGMGLPNMKNHTDYMRVESTPGVGTKVHIKIFLRDEDAAAGNGVADGDCIAEDSAVAAGTGAAAGDYIAEDGAAAAGTGAAAGGGL
jgi:hypothetical protein